MMGAVCGLLQVTLNGSPLLRGVSNVAALKLAHVAD